MIAEGIGTGIVIDGQVYRGEKGAAGEFGHMFLAETRQLLAHAVAATAGKLMRQKRQLFSDIS